MDLFLKMIQSAGAERPSKKSELETRLEGLSWAYISNHCLINRMEPDLKPLLHDNKSLFDYYRTVLGYAEVLVTKAYSGFAEPLGENYRAVYVKGEPNEFVSEPSE